MAEFQAASARPPESRCLHHNLGLRDSEDFSAFQVALERVVPSMFAKAHPYWRYEGLDAFRFAVARKLGPEEAEFIGMCLLVGSQTWTPFHLRLHISPQSDSIDSVECRLGESGSSNGGMVGTPHGSTRETKLLYSVAERLASIPWAYTFTR